MGYSRLALPHIDFYVLDNLEYTCFLPTNSLSCISAVFVYDELKKKFTWATSTINNTDNLFISLNPI